MTQPDLPRPVSGRASGLKCGVMAFVLSAHCLTACSMSGEPEDGVVIDEATGRPISGAIVEVLWYGNWTRIVAESSSGCYHVETARTDANGRYHTPAWRDAWQVEDLRLTRDGMGSQAFKPGYWSPPGSISPPGTIKLVPFTGTTQEYFDKVLRSPGWMCVTARKSYRNHYKLFDELAKDASAKATTPQQRALAQSFERLRQEALVDRSKPTAFDGRTLSNVDPSDNFRREDLAQ